MDNIVVKEYVRGSVRHNVFEKIIRDTITIGQGYVEATPRTRGFFKSQKRLLVRPLYRFDSYLLGDLESKLVRSMYGPVSLIVYDHWFSHAPTCSISNFMSETQPYKVERFDLNNVIIYREFKRTASVNLTTRTVIFLNKKITKP